VITRLLIAILLGGTLLVVASFLHIISIAYLAGVVSGLALGMVMWFRFAR
jgi:hypothetical protein